MPEQTPPQLAAQSLSPKIAEPIAATYIPAQPKIGNTSRVIIFILAIVVLGLSGIVGILLVQQNDEPAPTQNVTETQNQDESDFSSSDTDSTVDQVTDEILQQIEDIDSTTDYENFDSEVEFGL